MNQLYESGRHAEILFHDMYAPLLLDFCKGIFQNIKKERKGKKE
jgi:hypothetical protein